MGGKAGKSVEQATLAVLYPPPPPTPTPPPHYTIPTHPHLWLINQTWYTQPYTLLQHQLLWYPKRLWKWSSSKRKSNQTLFQLVSKKRGLMSRPKAKTSHQFWVVYLVSLLILLWPIILAHFQDGEWLGFQFLKTLCWLPEFQLPGWPVVPAFRSRLIGLGSIF